MTFAHSTSPAPVPQVADYTNVDLVLRYCPGLTEHMPHQIARYIPADPTECWPWPYEPDATGYCRVSLEATPYGYAERVNVHRYLYDVLIGDIPLGYHIHHTCQNKRCWNFFHLKEVTPKEHQAAHRALRAPTPWRPPVQLLLAFMAHV